ncbi:PDZ domain-containing protein [Gemmata sp. G18]|uniref:PDZ domain-containing protein n=1 Tax=Gemmata palustris TaxID=2822762 RepID=A0ABS5BV95_9BACT|nr:PDZ domain-containing protein [Gemmata palustris]MBP3957581.1 PDZ domain-containing protein [Gemmata palustris]
MTSRHPRIALGLFALAIGMCLLIPPFGPSASAQPKGRQKGDKEKDAPAPNFTLPDSWAKSFSWRNIGPANMGGRITAISVFEADPSTYWVATASGGLLKTTNNGVTFAHQFDKEATVSIGDVCVSPSNRDIVWVGTGENNPRNSVSFGDGVYKSTDGGKTWKHMGLKKSFQTGRIRVHPTNPEVVFVGALGRLYGPNEERGLFKTTDGGKTWEKALYVDDKTGAIDVCLHPTDPDTIFVAMWERRRDEYDSWPGGGIPDGYDSYDPVQKWGAGAGIYKSTDGGKTFKKLTTGLPTSNMGRIGLDIYRKDPKVMFAVIDCEKIGMGVPPKKGAVGSAYLGLTGEDAEGETGAKVTRVVTNGPADTAGVKVDDVVNKMGNQVIKTYDEALAVAASAKPTDKVTVQLKRGDKDVTVELTYGDRPVPKGGGGFGGPGGASATRPFAANYGGQAANVQEQQGPDGFQYGGVYKSTDGGESWKRINSINPRPMYFSQIRVDPSDEKFVYILGVTVTASRDGGRTFQPGSRAIHDDQHALWIDPKDGRHMIVGTDGGFYSTYDRGANWDHHNNMALGQFYHVAVCNKKPYWVYGGLQDNGCWGQPSMSLRGGGPVNEDVISLNSGDGYVCRVDPNDPDQVYAESQNGGMVRYNLRTGERASIKPTPTQGGPRYRFNWNTPYILSAANSHILYSAGNYVFKSVKKGDNPQIISPEISRTKHGSATALAESPRNPDVLFVGTDDGYLWRTKNGGKDWTNITDKIGLKKPTWIATIEPSRFADGRVYVCLDAHRMDDDSPHVYTTDDLGETWKPITGNLPVGSTRCLREDVTNPNLLFCGTEFALFASLDRGKSWTKINNNLPTVAVHEVAIHPTAGEIVAATHGRSLWILDVTALRQMASEKINDEVTLYKPNAVVRWQSLPSRGRSGRRFVGENPAPGAHIFYSLPKKATKVALEFQDIDGKKVGELTGGIDPGLHKLTWSTSAGGGGGGGFPGGGGGGGRFGGRQVPAGAYRIVLTVDGQTQSQSFTIEGDPAPARVLTGEEEDEEEDDDR